MIDAGSALGGFLVGATLMLIISVVLSWRTDETPQRATQSPRFDCVCGQTFYDEQEAKDHAHETHNAPVEDGEWRHIVEAV